MLASIPLKPAFVFLLLSPALLITLLIFILVLTEVVKLALRSRQVKLSRGYATVIGKPARVHSEIAGGGSVFLDGYLWQATSGARLRSGQNVTVTGIRGLLLTVEPMNE